MTLWRTVGAWVTDGVYSLLGLCTVVIGIWAVINPPDSLRGVTVVSSIGLSALGLLLLATVIDRRTKLDLLVSRIESLPGLLTDSRYLPNARAVERALQDAVDQTKDRVLAVGSKSTASDYLQAIERAIAQRGAKYYRILEGDDIHHALHEHLVRARGQRNVFIGWADRENYGNITVCDDVTIFAFPSPDQDSFSGLSVFATAAGARYGEQIYAIYAQTNPKMNPVDEARLKQLCLDCRSK
jgi:hypothetical protein